MWRGIEPQLREALGGRKLDYIFVTHPELPHSAALPLLMDTFPEATLIGDMSDYHLFYPEYMDRAQNVHAGDTLALGDKSVSFIDAAIRDLPGTLWAFEDTTQTMFVCDGFSITHTSDQLIDPVSVGRELLELEEDEPVHFEGECAQLTSELSNVDVSSAALIIERALYWSRYVKPDLLFGEVTRLFEQYPPKLVAPSHGNVIDNIAEIQKTIIQAHELAYKNAISGAG
jgi:flavorubredoxin